MEGGCVIVGSLGTGGESRGGVGLNRHAMPPRFKVGQPCRSVAGVKRPWLENCARAQNLSEDRSFYRRSALFGDCLLFSATTTVLHIQRPAN